MEGDALSTLKLIDEACQKSSEGQIEAGNANRVAFCFDILKSEGIQDEVIEQSLLTLIHLVRRVILDKSTTCRENQSRCKDHIAGLVTCVETFISKPKIVYASCVLMMILASDNEDNQMMLGDSGATKLVIKILQTYDSDVDIQEFALRCVRNFSACEDVACKLTDDGIGECLQKILTTSNSITVLEAATWAVVNLSYDEDVAALLGSVGCCTAILTAYPGGTALSPNGLIAFCWAVRNLSCPSLNIGTFAKSNVAELIMDIVRNSGTNYELLHSAIWCINNLTCSITLLRNFLDLGAAELLVRTCRSCMTIIKDDIELGPIAEATVFTLRNLSSAFPKEEDTDGTSSSSEPTLENINQTRLGSLGSIELVSDILMKYMDREGMVENCFNTISAMCRNHPFNLTIAGDIGFFNVVVEALAKHKDALDTVEIGLKCLIVLCSGNSANVERLIEMRGVSLVVEYMKHHRTDYDVCTASCELLFLLHYRDEISREELKSKNQLSEDGLHARPAGRFDDIAAAWKIDELVGTANV